MGLKSSRIIILHYLSICTSIYSVFKYVNNCYNISPNSLIVSIYTIELKVYTVYKKGNVFFHRVVVVFCSCLDLSVCVLCVVRCVWVGDDMCLNMYTVCISQNPVPFPGRPGKSQAKSVAGFPWAILCFLLLHNCLALDVTGEQNCHFYFPFSVVLFLVYVIICEIVGANSFVTGV